MTVGCEIKQCPNAVVCHFHLMYFLVLFVLDIPMAHQVRLIKIKSYFFSSYSTQTLILP